MASNRQERFLMRQRGAGTHKTQDFDFGLAFPGASKNALAPQLSTRSTRSQKTPKSIPQSGTSTRKTPASRQRRSVSNEPTKGAATNEAASGRKTRSVVKKTSSIGRQSSTLSQPPSSSRSRPSTRAAEKQSLSDVRVQTALSDVTSPTFETAVSGTKRKRGRPSTKLQKETQLPYQISPLETAEAEPPLKEDGAAQTIVQGPGRPRKARVDPGSEDHIAGSRARGSKSNMGKSQKIANKLGRKVEADEQGEETERSDEEAELHQTVMPVMVKRKRPLDVVEEEEGNESQNAGGKAGQEDSEDEISSPPMAKERGKQRKMTPGTVSISPGHPPGDKDPHRITKSKSTASVPSKSIRRRGDTTGSANRSRPKQRSDSRTIPITIYQHNHLQMSNVAGDSSNDEVDPLGSRFPQKFIRPSGPTPIDVLVQVSKELIAERAENLNQESSNQNSRTTGRSEMRRKRKVVQAFGDDLEERCFELTEALDYNLALEVRVRQAKREKTKLRDELLQLRREREEVALETDAVRRKHSERASAAQGRNELNDLLHNVALAVQRGRTKQRILAAASEDRQADETTSNSKNTNLIGLERLLNDVAADVSSTSKAGGLLKRVKDFNGFLETVAGGLERKM
ncbi:MAG: hypothetical protein M1837_005981 [Sclerophora amabilis]|nr:MAG: hypothetical protein M1837_005981 [Sclerophora amabilis]